MLLRDVIERHAVSNTQALRWLQRHLLATPGGRFSVKKLYDSLRSQGVPVAKDTLYEYLDHLQDAFLIRTVRSYSGVRPARCEPWSTPPKRTTTRRLC